MFLIEEAYSTTSKFVLGLNDKASGVRIFFHLIYSCSPSILFLLLFHVDIIEFRCATSKRTSNLLDYRTVVLREATIICLKTCILIGGILLPVFSEGWLARGKFRVMDSFDRLGVNIPGLQCVEPEVPGEVTDYSEILAVNGSVHKNFSCITVQVP